MIAGKEQWPILSEKERPVDNDSPAKDHHGQSHDGLKDIIKQSIILDEYSKSLLLLVHKRFKP